MFNEIPLPSRRRLLRYGGSVFIMRVMGTFSKPSGDLTVSKDRPYWRFCNECQVMFYTDSNSNSCAAGGTHVPQGHQFRLPFDVPGTPTAQTNWRFCNKCYAMFYNGYCGKGRCAAGGGHVAQGYNFVLPHSR